MQHVVIGIFLIKLAESLEWTNGQYGQNSDNKRREYSYNNYDDQYDNEEYTSAYTSNNRRQGSNNNRQQPKIPPSKNPTGRGFN